MSKHYVMQNAKRELSRAEAEKILDAGEFCTISSVDADGTPYGVPISYVMHDGKLYVHTSKGAGHKFEDWRRDPRVCVSVVTEVEPVFADPYFTTRFASVVAMGTIREIEDVVEKKQVLVALCMKYLPEFKHKIGEAIEREFTHTGIWAVDLDEIRGKGARRKNA